MESNKLIIQAAAAYIGAITVLAALSAIIG